MGDVKWIKITTNMFEDEKIDFIESLPEADAILVIWVKLLTLAGKCNTNGFIFLTENIPYTDEMLSHKFRRPLNTVKLALQTLKRLKMIEFNDEGYLKITNWEKHQNVEGLERIREQTRKRVAKHRAKKMLEEGKQDECNVTVTLRNATEEEGDIDIDKDKEVVNNPFLRELLNQLKNIDNYPFDIEKDTDFINSLLVDFPTLDIKEELKKWATYKLDKPLTKKSNARSQFRNWCKKSAEWKAEKEPVKSNSNKIKNISTPVDLDALDKKFKEALGC
ncbi:MAG: phage replisome organizer N-terminal domain-containing protein [Christensenellales bacterium]|jgi:predicted phage replisome organizer